MRFGIRARLFAIILPAILVPPLWVGHQASRREVERVRQQSEVELHQQVRDAQRRLADHVRRVDVELKLLPGTPAFRDHIAFRELGLFEEAEVHRQRLEEIAGSLLSREGSFAAAGFMDAAGAALAWAGNRRMLPHVSAQLQSDLGFPGGWLPSPDCKDGHRFVSGIGKNLDQWGVLQGWVVVVLDLRELTGLLGTPSANGVLTLRTPGHACPVTGTLPTGQPSLPAEVLDHLAEHTHVTAQEVLGHYMFFDGDRRAPPEHWQVGALVPLAHLYSGIDRIRRQTLEVALLGILIACLLAAWVARKMGGRIHELAEQATAIGEGRFDLALPEQPDDELGTLANTMQEMGFKIRDTRDQLVQAEKLSAIGLLSSGIAHEIHSPLQSITATASSLRLLSQQGEADDDELEEIARDISDAVGHAAQITSALQQYARTSREAPDVSTIPLRDVVERARMILRGRKDARRVRVEGEADLEINGDFNQLVQVVLNLVRNALDATPNGERVELVLSGSRFTAEELEGAAPPEHTSPFRGARRLVEPVEGAPAVELRIIDHGSGISEENLLKIFDPFFTTKAPGQGTGLGLSITQGIVWVHGGLLDFQSQVGEGTTVTVKLPMTEEPI